MKKPVFIKLTILILMLFLLTACNGGFVDFRRKASKMSVELDGYTIVTNKYIKTDQQQTNYDPLIKKALDDKGISYHKDHFKPVQIIYKDKYMMFNYKLRIDQNEPAKYHYVLCVIDTTSFEVTILRTYLSPDRVVTQSFFDLIDGTYALIKTEHTMEYVILDTNEVIRTFEVEPLMYHGNEKKFAYIDEDLILVEFDGPNIIETPHAIDDVVYNRIKGDYLLNTNDRIALNYKTGIAGDYDDVLKDPFHFDEYTYEITFMGENYTYDEFMMLSSSLSELDGYLKEDNYQFNHIYFVTTPNGSYLALYGHYGGLMFMQSYTPHYYFKYEDNTFKYIGYGDYFFDAYITE